VATTRHGATTRRVRCRTGIALASLAAALIVAPSASAACSPAVRADSRATQETVAQLVAGGDPAATDVAALAARARRSCLDIRPARSIALATLRLGAPREGQRARVLGVDLVGLQAGGAIGWRLDLARAAARLVQSRDQASRQRYAAQLAAASFGEQARTWSADPTRLAWDPGQQSAILAALARGGRASYGPDLDAGVRAFTIRSRTIALARLPVLQHLRIVTRVALAADGTTVPGVRTAARIASLRTLARVRAARVRGWSRIDGRWSTGVEHRQLAAQATELLRRQPHAPSTAAVAALQAALVTPARIELQVLPNGAFYPWPRDGAFDTSRLVVDVDKPATLTLLVYAPDGRVRRRMPTTVVPGRTAFDWDGADDAGTVVEPGEYRYNVVALDLVGNRARIPGLEHFEVARDTTAPRVVDASLRVVGTGATRRAIASWNVDEPLSPVLRSWLVLGDGTRTTSIRLHESLRQATVRRAVKLGPGTWRATLVFIDGSGNRTQHPAGSFTIR
jgi:hypothetical protein